MSGTTTKYAFTKPVVGGDTDDWGGYLNTNWDTVDALLAGTHADPVDGIDMINATGEFTTLDATAGTLEGMTLVAAVGGLESLSVTNEITEGIQLLAPPQTPPIDPENGGTIATWTLTAGQEHTPSITLLPGESITLMILVNAGATITWGSVQWINGEPTLADNGTINVVELFNVGGVNYATYVGSVL